MKHSHSFSTYYMKFSVDCSLCVDSSIRALKRVVKCLKSWYVGDPQNEYRYIRFV